MTQPGIFITSVSWNVKYKTDTCQTNLLAGELENVLENSRTEH